STLKMGLSRRAKNLIVDVPFQGAKWLRCVDLAGQLFGNTATPPPPTTIAHGSESAAVQEDYTSQTLVSDSCNPKKKAAGLKMERIRLPRPILKFRPALNEACRIDCFPFVDHKMFWVDHLGRPFLFEAETRLMDMLPCLHKPKSMPFSVFVPNADADNDYEHHRPGSSLFVMERIPKPEVNSSTQWSDQFEAFVYCKHKRTSTNFSKTWQWQLLPPPPYVREPKYWHSCSRPEISSYTSLTVNGDPHICISIDGVGTYCLNTASHTWIKVGNWTLPFHGRVEYVPEFNLWFGFSSDESPHYLAASNLSAMDSQPQLVGRWEELYLPEDLKECKNPQLVNLGSGRFCITRFFHSRSHNSDSRGDVDQNVAVFTGVEVKPCFQDANGGSGKVELQMIPHKSLFHKSNHTTIDAVF
ncbi:Os03g0105300, partial [Oryza sativa Japonica Group]